MKSLDNYLNNEENKNIEKADRLLNEEVDKLELRSNVLNHLKLLMTATFEDTYGFLDEDIQNAQRAGATEFRVTTSRDTIVIENNGAVLDDFQKLFSISESGWSDSVMESEQPFGMGFFSNTVAASRIEVYSGNKKTVFEPLEMIKTSNVEIVEELTEEYYDGFKIVLSNINKNNISVWDIKDRLKATVKYIPLDVYYNGSKLESGKDFVYDGDNPSININEEGVRGFIYATSSYFSTIAVYHKGRFVCNLDCFRYIKGDIEIGLSEVTLKAPDRKGIVKDNKYYDFTDKINKYISDLCISILDSEDDETINKYSDLMEMSIYNEESANRFKSHKKFLILDTRVKSDSDYLTGISLCDKEIHSLKDYDSYLEEADKVLESAELATQQSNDDIVEDYSEDAKDTAIEDAVDIIEKVQDVYSEPCCSATTETTKTVTKEEKINKIGSKELITGDYPIFYATVDCIIENQTKVGIAKLYNLKVIVTDNKFELALLKKMRDRNVVPLEELSEDIEVLGELTSTELTPEEQRAGLLFSYVASLVGLSSDTFIIGNLMCYKTITISALNKKFEDIDENIVACISSDGKNILVDRSIIEIAGLTASKSKIIRKEDLGFILANLETIVKNIHLLDISKSEEQLYGLITKSLGKVILR